MIQNKKKKKKISWGGSKTYNLDYFMSKLILKDTYDRGPQTLQI